MSSVTFANHFLLPVPSRRSFKELIVSWFCGVNTLGEGALDEREREKQSAKDERATSLEQNSTHRILIAIIGVITFSTGVGQLIFWSVWKYTPPPLGDSPPT